MGKGHLLKYFMFQVYAPTLPFLTMLHTSQLCWGLLQLSGKMAASLNMYCGRSVMPMLIVSQEPSKQLASSVETGKDPVTAFLSFVPKGGAKWDCVDYCGGKYYICVQGHIHVQSMWQTRWVRGHAPPEKCLILDLLLDEIWWNLGLFSHNKFMCH